MSENIRYCWLCGNHIYRIDYLNININHNTSIHNWNNKRKNLIKKWNDKRIELNCCTCTKLLNKLQKSNNKPEFYYSQYFNCIEITIYENKFYYSAYILINKLMMLIELGLIKEKDLKR